MDLFNIDYLRIVSFKNVNPIVSILFFIFFSGFIFAILISALFSKNKLIKYVFGILWSFFIIRILFFDLKELFAITLSAGLSNVISIVGEEPVGCFMRVISSSFILIFILSKLFNLNNIRNNFIITTAIIYFFRICEIFLALFISLTFFKWEIEPEPSQLHLRDDKRITSAFQGYNEFRNSI